MTTDTEQPVILVVDDEPAVRESLARGLWAKGHSCATAADATEALERLAQARYAVLLCDIRMPGMDGMELLRQALARDPDMEVIMVTAMAGIDTALTAIRQGAYDYLTKPFRLEEVELAVKRALEHRRLRLENRVHVEHLEKMVALRTTQVQELAINVITSLGLALEAKDPWTHDHSRRVGDLAMHLGQQLGLDESRCKALRLAGTLHDLGKIGVNEAVLLKPGRLTPEEYIHIKLHPELGARILSPLPELAPIIPFIRHHHERWDGSGYPDGLVGEAIPHGARILAVADVYVAMRENRPYRAGMAKERVLKEMRLGAQRLFDVHSIGALLALDSAHVLDELDHSYPQEIPSVDVA
jgi:response regulator RpfG family c-di-GMP phosphodiesterase